MTVASQGNGSSPLGPIRYKPTKKDRKKLSSYDLQLHYHNAMIEAMERVRHPGLKKLVIQRNRLDQKRKTLRMKMKGYSVG